MINIHYAIQTCDSAGRSTLPRYCNKTKNEITQRCVTSLIKSALFLTTIDSTIFHHIAIIDDHSSTETVDYLKSLCTKVQHPNIRIEFIALQEKGLMNSTRTCFDWLEQNGTHLIFQVMDDYLFEENAIFQMCDMFFNMTRYGSLPCISSFNFPGHIADVTSKVLEHRLMVYGIKQIWFQKYVNPCTFLTAKDFIQEHRDIIDDFCNSDPNREYLEENTFGKAFKERNVICMSPIQSVALHLQTGQDKDPFIDWEARWNSVSLI